MANTDKAKSILARFKKTTSIEQSSVFSESELHVTKETCPTPIPIINLALSGRFFSGGISRGSTVIAGASRSFKTNIGLLCLKAYLDKYEDGIGLLYDSEFSFTPEYLSSFGIDQERVFISPITDLDVLKNDIINQVDSIEKDEHVFILIDSIGNLASLKELSDAHDGKSTQDMTRAKAVKSLFRMITPRVNLKNIPLFTINHTYETMEMYSKTVISGGTGILLSANTAIIMSRRKNQNKEEAGFEFVMKAEKSRFIREGIKFPLTIPEGGQIKKYSGLFDLALETGFIMKDGMKYIAPELPDYPKSYKKEIENNESFWNRMFKETTMIETIENALRVSVDQTDLFKPSQSEMEEASSLKDKMDTMRKNCNEPDTAQTEDPQSL